MTAVDRWRAFRQRVIATRSGRLNLRIITATVGAIVVVSGLILVPLPGRLADRPWRTGDLGLEGRLGPPCSGVHASPARGLGDWVNQWRQSVGVQVGLSGPLSVGAVTWASRAVSLKPDTPAQPWDRLVDP
jgi:hypothetical protein